MDTVIKEFESKIILIGSGAIIHVYYQSLSFWHQLSYVMINE